MKLALTLVLSATAAFAAFGRNVRIDHENRIDNYCIYSAITVGPSAGQGQPILVAIEDDSCYAVPARSEILFQKSTDAGATWLTQDVMVCRGNPYVFWPDVAADRAGNIYVAFTGAPTLDVEGHVYCARSTDGGATWSEPAKIDDNPTEPLIGYVRIATDSAGNLLAAWNQMISGDNFVHIFSSVSTDRGATWQPKVRLDDTAHHDCYHADVTVQPGSNAYLVAASIRSQSCLYRSTDGGETFQPGVRLDTFHYAAWQPHVVADREHIIYDYTGTNSGDIDRLTTEARTFYFGPDTWGIQVPVPAPDTHYSSNANGARLALSGDGRVHMALMYSRFPHKYDLATLEGICYVSSTDHGASWSDPTRVDDTTGGPEDPDIGADSAGSAYVIWADGREGRPEIWFATNNPAAIAERPLKARGARPIATVVRRLPIGTAAFDAMGRRVLHARPGIYFLRTTAATLPRKVLLVE